MRALDQRIAELDDPTWALRRSARLLVKQREQAWRDRQLLYEEIDVLREKAREHAYRQAHASHFDVNLAHVTVTRGTQQRASSLSAGGGGGGGVAQRRSSSRRAASIPVDVRVMPRLEEEDEDETREEREERERREQRDQRQDHDYEQ